MNIEALIKVDIQSLKEVPVVANTQGFSELEELLGPLAVKVLEGLEDMKARRGLVDFLLENDQSRMYLVLNED